MSLGTETIRAQEDFLGRDREKEREREKELGIDRQNKKIY